jgi:cob(I)alamin adenosyltransferase
MTWGWIRTEDVVAALRDRPAQVSVVLTGRDAPDAIVDVADTVTEMVNRKHAFDRGIAAIRGIDF